MSYQPNKLEEKWVAIWDKEEVYKTPKLTVKKKKQFVLAMFPYPSGDGLHVGHVRIYTGTDVMARYFRMKGYQVLHPMGWDAFGLPAENRAIKEKNNPQEIVPKNILNFKRQMKRLGFSYDWGKEFSTTDPQYYRFTQWLFIQFFKMGLLEKKEIPVYFCPFCKTGLAEEEVLPDGTHERCGKSITRKTLPQWVFKITKYADRLLEDLEGLDWPAGILEMQRNWIGKSEGAEIIFKIAPNQFPLSFKKDIKVFTTRADTLFGVTALVVAPEHWLVNKIINSEVKSSANVGEIKKYVEEAKRKLDLTRTDLTKEKTGIFTGLYALHPLTGERIPIWVADYVLGWYGEGAVMVVPAHDERDFQFAKKFNLPIKKVVIANSKFQPSCEADKSPNEKIDKAFTDYGILVNSGEFDGLTSKEAIKKITEKLEKLGLGRKAITFKLRDWIFSRQRYWGEPIPLVTCQKCGWVPLKEEDLPLELPYLKFYEPTKTGESPLSRVREWVKTTCPVCGGPAERETDTMPNWAGSCWYFLAFPFWKKDKNKSCFLVETSTDAAKRVFKLNQDIEDWLPVDWYLGGAEHAVLHLLYARFWVKALYDLKLLSFKEPFLRLRNVGMVLAEDRRKMSKSFGNVINPDEIVKEYGADALRVYEMFMAPFNQEIAWSTKALQGAYRFLKRVKEIYEKESQDQKINFQSDNKLKIKLQKTIKKVTEDIEATKFNTAIAAMMEFLNEWEKTRQSQNSNFTTQNKNLKSKIKMSLSAEDAKKFLQILAPFAPFLTEEIWREVFKEKTSIHLSSWPEVKSEIIEEEIVIPIQINGKLRDTLTVLKKEISNKELIEKKALLREKVKKYLRDKKYKMIYVEGKIVNFIF